MQRAPRLLHSKGAKWRAGTKRRTLTCSTRRFMQLMVLLIVFAASSLLIAVNLAADTHGTAAGLRHLTAELKEHVLSNYGITDGYWHLELNYSTPPAPGLLTRTRYLLSSSNSSCWDIATAHPEPYSAEYDPKQRPPESLPGGVPRAIWKWNGSISRRLFESVPFLLRDADVAPGCTHCTFVLRYKVINGQLYTDKKRRHRALDGQEEEVLMLEELLLASLHMYQVPDVDFLLHLGDGSPAGLPLVQVNINRSNDQAGFTIPKFMWRDALGPEQFQVLFECLQARYPVLPQQQRRQRAVWRGSNTDSRYLYMDEKNVMHVLRTRLHLYGMWYPNILDAQYTAYAQQAFDTNCIEELMPLATPMALEHFNRYALILDIDGNGWSDRYRLLAHFNTPVLKQASNLTAFFEHLFAPGVVVEHYAHDLSDLPVRAAALLQELQHSPGRLLTLAEHQQGLAHYLLNQVALMHATAYTLSKVAELNQWKPAMEESYGLVPFSKCCTYAKQLPAPFIHAVRARGVQQQQQTAQGQ